MKPTCLEPDYLRELAYSEKRIPVFVRNHIRDCLICQENLTQIHKETPLPKSAYGEDFAKVLRSWKNGLLPEVSSENPSVIIAEASDIDSNQYPYRTALFRLVYKYRKWIYLIAYSTVGFAILYRWSLLS
ncbi:hypothetical protein LEP1GSC047_0608 [Leptospira inadai serovar Lyme str. 10]|uniref:Uncharacterized protein n=2 Tax=Leptospira inadai serovar Lyme TaxID=293084 RepID=V6HEM8_9LEPT|nr:hypothetical protein LEP1GSC047_0608 [Leptospira inadai serovar Lyme str. 10]PNV72270.1 hypothetical protein BES34_019635 [Leptospira inadai serovar Lyme]